MINKYINIPLYSQLKDLIVNKIEQGEYSEGSKIPSEENFCEMYDISRPTVRQAINELTNNGYVYKEKGKGTFVAKRKSLIDIKNYNGFTDSILDNNLYKGIEVVKTEVLNDQKFTKYKGIFNIPSGQQAEAALIMFLTISEEQMVAVNTSLIPLSLFPSIIQDVKMKKPSHEILKGKYPFIPSHSKSSIEIVYSAQEEAAMLHVQAGQPLIKIDNVLSSKSGYIVEYIISKYRADKCRLYFENTKHS